MDLHIILWPESKDFLELKQMTFDETISPRYPDQAYWKHHQTFDDDVTLQMLSNIYNMWILDEVSFYLKRVLPSILPCYLNVTSIDFQFIVAGLPGWLVKNPPVIQKMWVWSLGREDPLEKEMATHSSILAWEIPWTEEPGGLQSMGLKRVRHSLATKQQQHSLCMSGICKQLCWVVLAQGLSWGCSWGICWGRIIRRFDWAGGPTFKMPWLANWFWFCWEPQLFPVCTMGGLIVLTARWLPQRTSQKLKCFTWLELEITHHHPCRSLLVTLTSPESACGGLYKGVRTQRQATMMLHNLR